MLWAGYFNGGLTDVIPPPLLANRDVTLVYGQTDDLLRQLPQFPQFPLPTKRSFGGTCRTCAWKRLRVGTLSTPGRCGGWLERRVGPLKNDSGGLALEVCWYL